MLDVRILDGVTNNTNSNHGVNNRCETTRDDVRLVIPFEGSHDRAAVDGNLLPQLRRDIGDFCFSAHVVMGSLSKVVGNERSASSMQERREREGGAMED